MSSDDYIARLRQELLRAGATRQPRWRPARVASGLRPLAAAAVALAALTVVLAWPEGPSDERPVEPAQGTVSLGYDVEPSAAERSARVMRERLAAAGIDARVSVEPGGGLSIAAPAAARAAVAALAQRGDLAFYDWERSVLGPDGRPAPSDPSVTGGEDAGRAAGVARAEAEARASRQPGARVVRAVDGSDRWFALGGEPALTGDHVEHAHATFEDATREPIVAIGLTPAGEVAFTTLTRELAQRGATLAEPDALPLQHLAIVIDDRIVATPYIDFRVVPDGIDGSAGAAISGDLTPESARLLAIVLNSGPLPAALE